MEEHGDVTQGPRTNVWLIRPVHSPCAGDGGVERFGRVIEAEIKRTLLTDEGEEEQEKRSLPPSSPTPSTMDQMWAREKMAFPNDNMFYVGLDLEGVDLGRAPGTLELIALSVSVCDGYRRTFVIDAAGYFFNEDEKGNEKYESERRRLLDILQNLLNHERCVTVLHDCRRDCDALWHHLKIKPRFVHDTSAAHWVLTGQENVNLNTTLENWDMPVNPSRGRIDYVSEPHYWAKRPLTREMIHYAAGDVHHLVPMAMLQQEAAVPMLRLDMVREQSEFYRDCLQDMDRTWVECKVDMGKFFGKGGCNIRLAEKRTGCFFYQSGDAAERNAGFQVYYPDEDSLRAARRALGWR